MTKTGDKSKRTDRFNNQTTTELYKSLHIKQFVSKLKSILDKIII